MPIDKKKFSGSCVGIYIDLKLSTALSIGFLNTYMCEATGQLVLRTMITVSKPVFGEYGIQPIYIYFICPLCLIVVFDDIPRHQ